MTVAVAGRSVIDLGARASVLDAVDRLSAAPGADELVLSVAAGAPLLRSPVFLEVLRRAAGSRRIAIVTPDARARSLAAAVHMPAFASVAALERHELDATEPLGPVRRAAIVATQTGTRAASPLRLAGIGGALLGAMLVVLAIVVPSATVIVAPVSQPLGPAEYDLRAGPNNAAGVPDINATTLGPANVSAKITGTATGTRTEETKATGIERFSNSTTGDVKIPKGTIVQTSDGIRFQTTEEKTLPHSTIGALPPFVTFGTVDIAIEAVNPGPSGNVASGRISQPNPPSVNYTVTNPSGTSGGDSKKFAVITLADYQLAASKADGELRKQADAQMATWTKDAAKEQKTAYGVLVSQTGVTPALADIVNRDAASGTFDLTVTGTATAYSVPAAEPRATVVKRLADEAKKSGNAIDANGAIVEIVSTSIDKDGVHLRVRGKTSQFSPVDEAAIRSALTGRPLETAEVTRVVEAHGVRFVRALAWPSFWPRMPLLDSRIQITTETTSAATP